MYELYKNVIGICVFYVMGEEDNEIVCFVFENVFKFVFIDNIFFM